jgi:hypothetical protein
VTHDISNLSCADVFRAPGVQTPIIARFSTVIHERGSPETLRDPRGFAVKFYTREGNWCACSLASVQRRLTCLSGVATVGGAALFLLSG